jgi:cytoskeletal protein CcmA (bactofilin family)
MFKRSQVASLTYLSEKTEFQGDLHVEGNLRIDGIIHGNVEVRGDLEISKSGLVEGAELRANNIVLHGVVKARVIAQGRLTLSRTSRLEGDVSANSLDIEAGAFYVGYISTTDTKALPGTGKLPELMSRDGESLPYEGLNMKEE